MKPREFDELVRQKFDQNDFAYNPKNWDSLAEELDGRAKKRSMIMWLWMPAVGMAASVALAIGVTSLLDFSAPGNGSAQYAQTGKFVQHHAEQGQIAMIPYPAPYVETPQQKPAKKTYKAVVKQADKTITTATASTGMGIRLENVTNNISAPVPQAGKTVAVMDDGITAARKVTPKIEKKAVAAQQPVYRTFKDETPRMRKPMNFSVILSGGVNQGSKNSGYVAGATVRKMINDKVYVEGDIAFTTSENVQTNLVMSYSNGTNPVTTPGAGSGGAGTAAKPTGASFDTSGANKVTVIAAAPPVGVIKAQDIPYSTYYAQITPGIGYKLMKRVSIGMGADFQQMLVDNRPATSIVDRGNIQVAPSFDVGFVGKTEYAFTKRVKAAVSYRKGINGVINPSDKFIDRDYLQFQMRCTIFNR